MWSLLVVALESQEKGLLNFRAIEGKPEGEGTLSGITDVGGMVRDGEDVLEFDASSGDFVKAIVLVEVCVVARERANDNLESVQLVSSVACVPKEQELGCTM